MEWSKIKNIILLILVLANVFLLILVGMREGRGVRYEEDTRDAAVATLERSGIAVALEHLPKEMELTALTVNRDRSGEAEAAEALLGGAVETGETDVRPRYTGPYGSMEFDMNGGFSAELEPGAWIAGEDEDYERASREALEILGFQGELLSSRTVPSGMELVFRQEWEDAPLFSCQVTLTWSDGSLIRMEGQRLVGTATPSSEGEPLSVANTLIRFLAGINEGGYVCSSIDGMEPGYVLSSSARPAQLSPVWRITTDTGVYYVDAMSGDLSLEE